MSREACGAYQHMMSLIRTRPGLDDLWNLADIKMRYAKLDFLIEDLKRGGSFREREVFREMNGIYVHFGAGGEAIFGGGGAHRLAICRALGLRRIPVQVGIVHSDFVRSGGYKLMIATKDT